MRKLIKLLFVLVVLFFIFKGLDLNKASPPIPLNEKVRITSEESVVIDVVEKIAPSVVTVGIEQKIVSIDPFDFWERPQSIEEEQNIGSGFIVSSDGLIVTNKHVVSVPGKYKVITHDGKKYDVESIYRDPANDIAIAKINPPAGGLKPVEMGDSSKVKVGQLVVAVGTPLGEFRGSVTKGIVSGIGRGITTGSPFQGSGEGLDDVIQTDAAINPGNSGGPLVNSSAAVIGVNTAIASGAENIGFALPINIIKESLKNFNASGQFNRPYLGVAYKIITKETALLNDVPEGAYIQDVVQGSSAERAGIQRGDIIVKIDDQRIQKGTELAGIIAKHKVGDTITLSLWRDGKTTDVKASLSSAPNQ